MDYLMNFLNFSLNEKVDPKVGTGKKPKGSDRRLYTDENPKDTVSVKFRTRQVFTNVSNLLFNKNGELISPYHDGGWSR